MLAHTRASIFSLEVVERQRVNKMLAPRRPHTHIGASILQSIRVSVFLESA
jgi:hypothetical protein